MYDDQKQFPRTVLWRRIDLVGMDACAFEPSGDGYMISGAALYQDRTGPAKLEYCVRCDTDWSSQSAWVRGWAGPAKREFAASRNAQGAWTIDGMVIEGVGGLIDIDLGFTPATNTNAIRRLKLKVGDEVETTAVWLDTEKWHFKPLTQVYRRLSETEFSYKSPFHNYAANLVTDDSGIIRQYPKLWTALSDPAVGVS